ncbi:hypothetical protein H9P43_006676 [Blastocladiella emersonii ATCC 22665]|nr:hypothetical protein H9P43_006676 [Blastocladiella emersonii ATCC 22665]
MASRYNMPADDFCAVAPFMFPDKTDALAERDFMLAVSAPLRTQWLIKWIALKWKPGTDLNDFHTEFCYLLQQSGFARRVSRCAPMKSVYLDKLALLPEACDPSVLGLVQNPKHSHVGIKHRLDFLVLQSAERRAIERKRKRDSTTGTKSKKKKKKKKTRVDWRPCVYCIRFPHLLRFSRNHPLRKCKPATKVDLIADELIAAFRAYGSFPPVSSLQSNVPEDLALLAAEWKGYLEDGRTLAKTTGDQKAIKRGALPLAGLAEFPKWMYAKATGQIWMRVAKAARRTHYGF